MPLHALHPRADVAELLAPAQVAQRGDHVDVGMRVVDRDGDGERLVVVPPVDDRGARTAHAGPLHDVGAGEVAADEVHLGALGQRVLGHVVPRAEHDLQAALGHQLGHDPLGAAGGVAEQDDVVPEVQRDHSSRPSAPGRRHVLGERREQQRQRHDATDDDVRADDVAARRLREEVAVADGRRRDDEVPPVVLGSRDLVARGLDQDHRGPARDEDQDDHRERQPPAPQPRAHEARQPGHEERHGAPVRPCRRGEPTAQPLAPGKSVDAPIGSGDRS